MSLTTQFLRRLTIFLLILNCLSPILVFGQDETTPASAPPEPTPTMVGTTVPGSDPTAQPSGTSLLSTPYTIIPTKSFTTSDSEQATTSLQETDPPEATTAGCALRCLATAAERVGCRNTGNRSCLCARLSSYLREAESCMQDRSCPSGESSAAISQQQGVCPSGPATSDANANTNTNTKTPDGPNSTPRPSPSPTRTTTVPAPEPTVGTSSGNGVNGQLTTQTQTLALTPGQIVTLGVSGTVRTTYTASTGLTTTHIATMLEAFAPGGNGGGGASGNGAMGLHIGCGMSAVVGIIGVLAGAIFVL